MNDIGIPFFELSAQYETIREELERAVNRVLRSGWYVLGPEVEAFENEFAAWCGTVHAIGVANGTEAIQLGLLACGLNPGDEVVTVANVSAPTVAAIRAAGMVPRLVDVDESSLNLSVERLEKFLCHSDASRVRAVIPVHLYGRPAEMDPILELARRRGLRVIEDAAQAHGAVYNGCKAGTLGDVGCFSFYPTKNLGALGDGGAVVTADPEIAGRLRMLRNYGEKGKYNNLIEGINSRLDEVQASILRVKLHHLDSWNRKRQSLAREYNCALNHSTLELPCEAPGHRHVYHLYVVRYPERDRLASALRERGIGTNIHYPTPIHLQPCYRALGYNEGDLPVTERACREVLSLPIYPELEKRQVNAVAENILDIMRT